MTPFLDSLSRRDFLKFAGLSIASFLTPLNWTEVHAAQGLFPAQDGRVARKTTQLFENPGFDSEPLKEHWRDIILPITGIAISEDETAYNRIWYKIGEAGFAYSGDIQPVRTRLNNPIREHPEEGSLAEVTVPYTDARKEASEDSKIVYRLYYETTHWITETVIDEKAQEVWYKLRDDKENEAFYYVLAKHLRIISAEELSPISPT